MQRAKSYHDSLIKALKDPTEAAEYINAAIEENDLDTLAAILGWMVLGVLSSCRR